MASFVFSCVHIPDGVLLIVRKYAVVDLDPRARHATLAGLVGQEDLLLIGLLGHGLGALGQGHLDGGDAHTHRSELHWPQRLSQHN